MVGKKKTVQKAPRKAPRKTPVKKPLRRAKRKTPARKTAELVPKKLVRPILRALLIFGIGGVLGTAFGIAVGIFIFPYIFPPPPANEIVTRDEQKGLVAVGTFIHANPRDPVHFGEGSVTVYRKLVHLGGDFKVGPGPAFHVYLSPRKNIRKNGDFSETAAIDLGKLRSFEGSQKYVIPEGTDLSKFKTVLVWCKKFGVLISPADLKRVSMQTSGKK